MFRVTAAQLRVALGDVRCGSGQTSFKALNALAEDLPELTEIVELEPVAAGANDATDINPIADTLPGDGDDLEDPGDGDDAPTGDIPALSMPTDDSEPWQDDADTDDNTPA